MSFLLNSKSKVFLINLTLVRETFSKRQNSLSCKSENLAQRSCTIKKENRLAQGIEKVGLVYLSRTQPVWAL